VAPRGSLVEPVALAFNDMAAQIQRTVAWKELLLQTVAHELRTPLSRVRFIAERVTDAEDAVERDDALAELDRELTELEDLLSSVLSLARADHGAALARPPTDLVDVLEGALDALVWRQRHRSPPLVLERVGIEAALPLARADRAAAARVFDNLLSNAAAHAHQRVRVVLAVEEDTLMIAVEDDGEGLPEDQFAHIFEPFVRLDSSRSQAGVGLGLAIVKRIVENHGHTITVGTGELGGLRVETRWSLVTRPTDQPGATG